MKEYLLPLISFSLNPESRELLEVLRRATSPDKTIILTIVDDAWTGPGSVLDRFLENFRIGQGTEWLLNHLLIVTVGRQTYQYCKSLHSHCFQLTPKQLLELLHKVIELGYNLVFTEANVMWLRNPIPEFNNGYEVIIPCDLDSKFGRNKQDRRDFYVKLTGISVEFFRYLKFVGVLNPNTPLGSFCEIVTQQEMMEMLGMQIQVLDWSNLYLQLQAWPR